MAYKIEKIEVWMGFLKDAPGELAKALSALSKAGAKLEFLFARPTKPGEAVFFLAPLKGPAVLKAAKALKIVKCDKMLSLKIVGPDKAGLGAKMADALGANGINIQGCSAMAVGKTAVTYLRLAKADIAKAQKILKKAL